MKKLFLSHYSLHASEVHRLAEELRFRGVEPWVDKQGGFSVAESSATEAERAIAQDCCGLLLYATKDVFGRSFVTDHEVKPALAVKANNPGFLLLAVPRDLGFSDLSSLSFETYGVDLSAYHTVPLPKDSDFECDVKRVADEVTRKVVKDLPELVSQDLIIQFSSIEAFPSINGEHLFIDARSAYLDDSTPESFDRLIHGMRSLKREIVSRYGRPKIRVEGFKHLSAAFAFGRVFQPFTLNIRQTPDSFWQSDHPFTKRRELSETLYIERDSVILAIEITSRYKELSDDVDQSLKQSGRFSRLVLKPDDPLEVNAELCCALADQCYSAIEMAVLKTKPREIHLFSAAPQALLMMIGRKFAGMPKTFAYDYRDGLYGTPKLIPSGPL